MAQISKLEIEKMALDAIKNTGNWEFLFQNGDPQLPYPANFKYELDMVMLGINYALKNANNK